MLLKTKHFGEINIDESKIIEFKDGIPGFELKLRKRVMWYGWYYMTETRIHRLDGFRMLMTESLPLQWLILLWLLRITILKYPMRLLKVLVSKVFWM